MRNISRSVFWLTVFTAVATVCSVIVVGALLSAGIDSSVGEGSGTARLFGFLALTLASVNIFGGFLVTERMLSMFKKKG